MRMCLYIDIYIKIINLPAGLRPADPRSAPLRPRYVSVVFLHNIRANSSTA